MFVCLYDLFVFCFNHSKTPTESFSENFMKVQLDLAEILRISKLDWHGREGEGKKGRRKGIRFYDICHNDICHNATFVIKTSFVINDSCHKRNLS